MLIPEDIKRRFKEVENVTPVDRRKMRNSCLSGHTGDSSLRCQYCRTARFNTLLTGYYSDTPTIGQVEAYLEQKEFDAEERREDYLFVLSYLGLSDHRG